MILIAKNVSRGVSGAVERHPALEKRIVEDERAGIPCEYLRLDETFDGLLGGRGGRRGQ